MFNIRGTVMKKFLMRHLKKRSASERIVYAFVFVIFTAFALSYLYILVWTFLSGMKSHDDVVMHPFALPETWHVKNYIEVFSLLQVEETGFFGMVLNSLYWSVLGSFISLMCSSMLAYVCCKYKFPGCKLYWGLSMFMMMMPIYGTGGATYKLFLQLGFVNSYSRILQFTGGMGINFLYFTSYYASLSDSYAEAARIDGANDWQIFFRVVCPQTAVLFGSLFLMAWEASWNDYSTALIYMPKIPTLAVGIYMFELEMQYHIRMDILYAAYFLAAVPPLVIFSLFNTALTANVSLGGIKE